MIQIDIPGWKRLRIAHVVLDLNGTLNQAGQVPDDVVSRVARLRESVSVHVASANTRGDAAEIAGRMGLTLHLVEAGREAEQKAAVVRGLGPDETVAIGNGANDVAMLQSAALGIAVIGSEGAAGMLLCEADVVVSRIEDALDLLLEPERLIATLRR